MQNLHGAIVADVVVKVFRMFNRPAAGSLASSGSLVWIVGTFGETATDFVRCSPDHLRVMAHFEEIILRRAVSKVVFLQEPRLGGKHPNLFCFFCCCFFKSRHIFLFCYSIKEKTVEKKREKSHDWRMVIVRRIEDKYIIVCDLSYHGT